MHRPSFGQRDRCPICRSLLSADPADAFGAAHCPRCAAPLWFVNFPTAGTRFMVRAGGTIESALSAAVRPLSRSLADCLPAVLADPGLDSLDRLELLAEVEAAIHELR